MKPQNKIREKLNMSRLATILIEKSLKIVNKKVNVRDLQQKFRATRGQILEIQVWDSEWEQCLAKRAVQVDPITGTIKGLGKKYPTPNGIAKLSLQTMLNLIKGVDDKGKPYTPKDAWRLDRLRVDGEVWLPEFEQFATIIYQEAFPQIKKDLGETL